VLLRPSEIRATRISTSPRIRLRPKAGLSGQKRGEVKPYTGNPFCCANSFSEVCGRAPICWITSAAASAPSRPAFS
jgi:hypothetical protein